MILRCEPNFAWLQAALCNLLRAVLIALFVTCLSPLAGYAQVDADLDVCVPPRYQTDVRPDSSDVVTKVSMGVRVIDILDIDDVNQTIKVDLAVRMRWKDPRLAGLEGCRLSTDDVWFPQLILENSGRIFSGWSQTVTVDKDSSVTYLQRMAGTFASYHQLADFPFDEQVITLSFYPLDWSSSKLSFEIDTTFAGVSSKLNISDWDVTDVHSESAENEFDAAGHTKSAYLLHISADRHLGYYIFKIMLPIALIVFMSCAVFWIDPEEFGTQIGLSATSVLTMVAFIFGTTNLLPRLGYVTAMDLYILSATVIVFLALLVTITTGYLAGSNRKELANRIDFFSRHIFPLGFATFVVIFYFMANT